MAEQYHNFSSLLHRGLGPSIQVYTTVPFNTGDKVRILEKKEKIDKGKLIFSKELYTIDKKEGCKIKVNETSKKLSQQNF
jgi:hypothetical protein